MQIFSLPRLTLLFPKRSSEAKQRTVPTLNRCPAGILVILSCRWAVFPYPPAHEESP
jgi:hypothetical protein